MSVKQVFTAFGTSIGVIALVLAFVAVTSSRLRADDVHSANDQGRIEQGFNVAPVHLTYDKHDRDLVGLGSYLVNVVAGCNGCHSAGPATEWADGHNPYFRLGAFTPPAAVNPKTYLGGGRDFGQLGPPSPQNVSPHIISRNLTPDNSGLPEQGAEFGEFFDSMRKGIDHDHLHPNCNGTTITTNCFNPPFNGDLLQVMPWPNYQNLTDRDLLAIYEYLKAVPCIASPGHSC